ncbi:protein FAM187B isoform X3 [Alexandromys fortis]|uniref:protein FAM187B isoform X3 n=1 Tax=Alexandromys fortis TaxID=100897 RepID=UPI0021527571|nr:protein FAM187B isoform X3 [Microtus fortis]
MGHTEARRIFFSGPLRFWSIWRKVLGVKIREEMEKEKKDMRVWSLRPVHWEVNETSLTWQDQLSGKVTGSLMDPVSGGQQLQIFQPAIYRCFVEQELIAQFSPAASVELLEAERQTKGQGRWQHRAQLGKADSVLRGLKLMLLMVSFLVVGGLLCKVVFRPTRGKKRNLVLLVK